MKLVKIVGMGMDGAGTLTADGKKAVEEADVLIGARRMTEAFANLGKTCFCSYDPSAIAEYIKGCGEGKIAVILSGDCGFFSGCEKLLPLLAEYRPEVICGISSPVYFCGKIGKTWQDLHFVSLHGAEDSIARNVASHPKTFFLLGGAVSAGALCSKLVEYGLGGVQISIGENLAAENEKISSGTAADFVNYQNGSLCVLLAENPRYEKSVPMGIGDGAFIRGSVPMTKSEVRAVAVSKLNIENDEVCWDVGSGTGSVTVEMALRCRKAYAAEKNPEASALTAQNCKKFRCDNVVAVNGSAPAVLADFPAPDKVFIGGSCGNLKGIFEVVFKKNPQAGILVTSVSLETLKEACEVFEAFGIVPEVTQVAVTRTRKVGSHTMLAAENPIFIINGCHS